MEPTNLVLPTHHTWLYISDIMGILFASFDDKHFAPFQKGFHQEKTRRDEEKEDRRGKEKEEEEEECSSSTRSGIFQQFQPLQHTQLRRWPVAPLRHIQLRRG